MKVKSQWEFGELFPGEPLRRVWSVSELTASIKQLLERHLGQVWVSGEVTNLRQQSSGHIYFTLKDAAAQLNCVLFRGEYRVNRDLLKDGQKVLLQGDLTVYEPRGQYQLRVTLVELQGIGALQLAFERLKQKLQAEGLFAPERKRPIPRFPERIGVVTSPTGAALRDVIHVTQRRNAALELILAPCRVQGDGAAAEIACAIRLLNQFALGAAPTAGAEDHGPRLRLDAILVTRGGGSLEDLWAFNEEGVARAIYESQVPVVSAVGHEIDFTISDFVADLRAATPSAAAELLTEGVFSSREFVAGALGQMRRWWRRRMDLEKEGLNQWQARLGRLHPRVRVAERWQRLDDLQALLGRLARHRVELGRERWAGAAIGLTRLRLSLGIRRRRERLELSKRLLSDLLHRQRQAVVNRLDQARTRLGLLSPANVLARGYSITHDAGTGQIVRDAQQVRPGQALRTQLHRGKIRSVVTEDEP